MAVSDYVTLVLLEFYLELFLILLKLFLKLLLVLLDIFDLSLNIAKALLDGLSETVPIIVSIDVDSGLHYQDFDS